MKLLRNCHLKCAHQQIISLKVSCINIVMAALWNRAGYYIFIFVLWFLSFFLA